jgi:hypothetical protein
MPAGLRGGDRVLVKFDLQSGRRPRMVAVERDRRTALFTATSFTIPGRVVDGRPRMPGRRHERGLRVHVGKPAVAIDLDLPASIALDEAAFARFSGPSIVRASLHPGFFGHRYFTDVRLAGRAWPADVRFAYDDARQRLVVAAPHEWRRGSRGGAADDAVRSDLFFFDAAGKELGAAEVQGRVTDAIVEADGRVLALVVARRWSSEASLVRLGDDGQVVERSVPVALDRVLGFDAATGSVWTVAGPTSAPAQGPHFIQRFGVAGLREPRLGPFESVPRAVVSAGDDVWVLENQRHRITRLDAASGRVVREYRDLNDPVDVAVARGTLYVIEAHRTQLTAVAEDGRILWRAPRFHGLAWAVADPTGGGWVGASTFEGAAGGVLRFQRDGTVTRLPATVGTAPRPDWPRRVGADVARSAHDGRLFFLAPEAIAVMSPDGVSVTRVTGFRFSTERRLRS